MAMDGQRASFDVLCSIVKELRIFCDLIRERQVCRHMMEEEVLYRDLERLSVSKRLVRSVSQKLRKKNKSRQEEADTTDGVSVSCFTLDGKGGGCKVADTGEDSSGDTGSRRRSSSSQEGKGYRAICTAEEIAVDCFSYAVRDKFWKKNNKRLLGFQGPVPTADTHRYLPDDILEMCLVRLPITSLMTARLVCRKWRYLTSTPRFMQMRREGAYQNPWVFVFGAVRDGYCSGEIHAFDVSLNQWHRINADLIKGRFMFSVASIQDDIYVVGGCSSLNNYGKVDLSSNKKHKGVLVFSPMNKSWRKIATMRYARSMPILGIFEVNSDVSAVRGPPSRNDRRSSRSRLGGPSDVFDDPQRLSVRRQYRNSFDGNGDFSHCRKSYKFIKQKSDLSNMKSTRRFLLIAVGGFGAWDEPLDSGEIYDPASNKWTEIQKLPVDFGIVCSGVACNGIFYVYSENDRLAGYDIERGYWIGIQTSLIPPGVHEYCPKLVSCNGRLFMLSVSWCEGDGQIGQRNKAVRKLWELDLMYLKWTELSSHPDAPMDWNATFIANENLIFGMEMFKIFGQVLDFLTVCDVSESVIKWNHISRNQMAHELDASSCMTKRMTVLYL